MQREKFNWKPQEDESTEAVHRGGRTRSSDEASVMEVERRGSIVQPSSESNRKREDSSDEAKSYKIPKQQVWEAYQRVKANQGAAGVDGESIADFEKKLKDNLYKLWNRMSSGSYFPPPVMEVSIPKDGGGERKLGIPTVSDRIAQMVVKMQIEPEMERIFHPSSYGYRPAKSAHDAIAQARENCWRFEWVLDLDIKGFFDNIPHDLLLKAVRKHVPEKWTQMYIERWLKAPMQDKDGKLKERPKGTPQGGVVSPLLANLYLHYAFDQWLKREYPNLKFERYADDAIVHCQTQEQAEELRLALSKRLGECGLELHPVKTKIVYCNNGQGGNPSCPQEFDFLGYTFRARKVRTKTGRIQIGFLPAVSKKATQKIRKEIKSWQLHRRVGHTLEGIAHKINAIIQGWINYYGKYYGSKLREIFRLLNYALARWASRKYKKLRKRPRKARKWLVRVAGKQPDLLAHWKYGMLPS